MPDFIKSPKFIISTIVVVWVAYVLWANFQLPPVSFHLIPFAKLDFNVSVVVVGSALFGAIATLVIQWLWRRGSSKKASESIAT